MCAVVYKGLRGVHLVFIMFIFGSYTVRKLLHAFQTAITVYSSTNPFDVSDALDHLTA